MKRLMERFMAKVEKTETCWLWKGMKLGTQGYGGIRVGDKLLKAHRVSYELFNGTIPSGFYVCHTCDNPPCVNPAHLFAGSALDNTRDKMRKGRYRNGSDTVLPGLLSEVHKEVWDSYAPEQRAARVRRIVEGIRRIPSEQWSEIQKSNWASQTPEQRAGRVQAVRQALAGKPFTPEHLTNLRAAHAARRQPPKPKPPKPVRTVGYGTGVPDPERPHGNHGKTYSPEHRAKLSAARRTLWASGAYVSRKQRTVST